MTPITPVTAAPAQLGQSTPNKSQIAKSAHDFEAMAIGQLLEPMFDTVDTANGAFGGGAGEEAWKPMLVQEIAKQIEAKGGFGLAGPVYEAMQRASDAAAAGGRLTTGSNTPAVTAPAALSAAKAGQ